MTKRILVSLLLTLAVGATQAQTAALNMLKEYISKKTPGAIAMAFDRKNIMNLAKMKKTEKEREAMEKLDFMGNISLRKADAEVRKKFLADARKVEADGYIRINNAQVPNAPADATILVKYAADGKTLSEFISYNMTFNLCSWLYMHGLFTMEDIALLHSK